MGRIIEVGSENAFTLLPEAERVKMYFQGIEDSSFSDTVLRFIFLVDDPEYDKGDTDEVDEAIQMASENGHRHYENVNIPQGPIGKSTKLYKLLKGMSGGDYETGERVDLDQFVGKHYLVDIELVDKMRPEGNKFVVAYDENGRPLKKAQIGKIRPAQPAKGKTKSAKKPVTVPADVPDDDSDLEFGEE